MHSSAPKAHASSLVLRDDRDGVARITLNRPDGLNALSMAVLEALESVFGDLAGDRSIRVVVVAANGRAFCTGHDLKEMLARRTPEFLNALFDRCCRIMLAFTRLPQPVIARVHGIATAAGCQLVAACDLAVASSEARFATSGINHGLFCATPAVPISRTLGRKHALEMLLTGEYIDADTALRWGLVNRVAPPESLDAAVETMCESLLAKPAAVVASGKRFFYRQLGLGMEEAYREAAALLASHVLGDEGLEGVSAFVAKRPPDWRR